MPPSLQFIYKIRPSRPEMLTEGPTPDEERIISDHFAYLKDLTEKGVVILAGRTLNTDPGSFGIVIFFADSEASALQVMQNDPSVIKKVMLAELFPFRVALSSTLPLETT